MTTDKKSLFAGFAMLAIFAFAAVTIYWVVGAGASSEHSRYVIYFDESVAGLSVNSTVTYRGVDAGSVDEITIDSNRSDQVRVDISLKDGIVIREDTVAVLNKNLVTGMATIDLEFGSSKSPALVHHDEELPEIATRTSLATSVGKLSESILSNVETITSSISKASEQLSKSGNFAETQEAINKTLSGVTETQERINRLLSDKNQESLEKTLDHLESFSAYLYSQQAVLNETMKNANDAFGAVNGVADSVAPVTEKFQETSSQIKTTVEKIAKSMKETSAKTGQALGETWESAVELSNESLKALDELMEQLRTAEGKVLSQQEKLDEADVEMQKSQ